MEIDLVEVELADYLRSKIGTPGRDVIPLPETQSELEKPFENTKVTVMFVSEKAQPIQGMGANSQTLTIQWGFVLQSNKLRGDDGIHRLAGLVKDKMNGYRPTDCDRLYYVSHDFVNFTENEWEHRLIFECKSMRVEIVEETTGPSLTSITYREP